MKEAALKSDPKSQTLTMKGKKKRTKQKRRPPVTRRAIKKTKLKNLSILVKTKALRLGKKFSTLKFIRQFHIFLLSVAGPSSSLTLI